MRSPLNGGEGRFILRRLAVMFITLWLVSLLTFAAFNFIPGDPAVLILGIEATNEQLAEMRSELGLDKSLPAQYFSWLGRFLTGTSVRFRGASITGLILERLPVTFSLASLSLLWILLISVPVSLLSTINSSLDRIVTIITTVNISIPGFFLGVLFIWVFGILLRCFTPGFYVSYQENLPGFLNYLLFPALAIAIPNAAMVIKFLRASILQQLRSDYVCAAYSRGASQGLVVYRHVLKNAIIPAITLLGMIIGEIFSGSIVIEQVFTIPGIGRLLLASITSRDFPLAQTLVVYIAGIVVIANTLVDLAIQIIDPRIRVG